MDDASIWGQVKRFLDERGPDSEFVVSEWAEKVQAEMGEIEPHLLAAWESELSLRQISEYLRQHLRGQRRETQRSMRRESIAGRIEDHASGVGAFDMTYHVGGKAWKPVRLMQRPDVEFVGSEYAKSSQHSALQAQFWAQIARKLRGGKTIGDVMSEADFVRLYRSITGEEAA